MSNDPSIAFRWWSSVQTAFLRSLSLPLSLSLSLSLSPKLSLSSLSLRLSLSLSVSVSLSLCFSLSLSLSLLLSLSGFLSLSLSLSLCFSLSLSLSLSFSLSLSLSLFIYLSLFLFLLSKVTLIIVTKQLVHLHPDHGFFSSPSCGNGFRTKVLQGSSVELDFLPPVLLHLHARRCKLAVRKVTKECVSWPSHNESRPRVDLLKMEEVYFSCKPHSTQTGLIVRIMIKLELRWLTHDVAPSTWAAARGDMCPCA